MKFQKMFSIVLMTILCFNIVSERVFADDVNNENISYEAGMAETYAKNEQVQAESTLTEESFDELNTELESKLSFRTFTQETTVVKAAKINKMACKSYKESDLRLLASIIYCEAGGESYAGKLAVGIVVMNRKSSNQFPNTIKGVIYQKNQFQPVRNGALNKALKRYDSGKFTSKQEKQCIRAAKEAMDGIKKVTYKSKKINLKGYHFFSRYLRGCRVKIGNHQFK